MGTKKWRRKKLHFKVFILEIVKSIFLFFQFSKKKSLK